MSTQNETAFLSLLSHSEGTARAPDPYRVCYGFSHVIQSLALHPYPGEWRGVSLANLGPAYAGKISTAAGRYQINHPSWVEGAAAIGATGFQNNWQDAWVLWKVKQLGAHELLAGGMIQQTLERCAQTWASLPGGSSGQPEHQLEELVGVYVNAGGSVA